MRNRFGTHVHRLRLHHRHDHARRVQFRPALDEHDHAGDLVGSQSAIPGGHQRARHALLDDARQVALRLLRAQVSGVERGGERRAFAVRAMTGRTLGRVDLQPGGERLAVRQGGDEGQRLVG